MTSLKKRMTKRKLSFIKNFFNGAPVPSNVRFPKVTWMEVEVAWDCDVSRMVEEDREMTRKDRKCSVRDLEPDTEYAIYLRCCGE